MRRKAAAGGKGVLTPRQQRFVQEYLLDLNATQAAIRAGYSSRTAEQQGPRLLGYAGVKRAIQAAQAKRAERVEVKQDEVLRELLRVAMADLRDAFDDAGKMRPVSEWPDSVAAFISSIEFDDAGGVKKVRLWPKVSALELLGKHLKLFTEKVEHTGKDGGPLKIESSPEERRARIEELLEVVRGRAE